MRKMKRLLLMAILVAVAGGMALGAVSTQYLGDDSASPIQGNWVGVVGADGYHLLDWGGNENQASYPPYLGTAQRAGDFGTYQWQAPGTTSEQKALTNAAQTQRSAATWYTGSTGYIRIPVTNTAFLKLGIYMMDWDQNGARNAEIAVCDISQEAAPPWTVTTGRYDNGRWLFAKVSAVAGDTISIRIVKKGSTNETACGLSFDTAGTVVDQFVVSDASSGSTAFTDDATVDVLLTGAPVEGAVVNGYMATESEIPPAADSTAWSTDPITSYTIQSATQGMITLYGWVRDDQGAVAGSSATIYYSTATPAISNVAATSAGNGKSITVTWDTDADAMGWVEYGL